jgi:hypothetical protein
LCAAALGGALTGCASTIDLFEHKDEGGILAKPSTIFHTPDWAKPTAGTNTVSLGPSGPVALEDLVGADGRCAPAVAAAAETAQAAQPAPAPAPAPTPEVKPEPVPAAAAPPPPDRAVGSLAGDLAGPPMPAGPPPVPRQKKTKPMPVVAVAAPEPPPAGLQADGPQVVGGIALGMTECDAVRRGGLPSNVSIGAGDKGERKVVLTYLTGNRPGIYTFVAGRLKEVDRAPEPPAPPPTAKKKIKKKIVKKKPPKSASNAERSYVQ